MLLRDVVGPTCFGSASDVVNVTSRIVVADIGLSKILAPDVSAVCLPGGQTVTMPPPARDGEVLSL